MKKNYFKVLAILLSTPLIHTSCKENQNIEVIINL